MMKILAAVDRSEFADAVLDITRRIAAPGGSKVLLLHVAPRKPDILGHQVYRKVVKDPVPEDLRDRRELLDRMAALLADSGIDHDTLMVRGEPVGSILEEAGRWGADLIILGSHGRGMLYRKLLGSVSEGVLREGEHSVLVVRAPNVTKQDTD